jgi:uncharacterized protein YrrD
VVRLKDLFSRDVVAMAEGLFIGHPADVLIDVERHCIGLIVVAAGKRSETSVVCPPDAVANYDEDTLAIPGLSSLRLGCSDDCAMEMMHKGVRMRGRALLSREGHMLGRIVGAEVDPTGAILQYEIKSPGLLSWLRHARVIYPDELAASGADTAVADTPELHSHNETRG